MGQNQIKEVVSYKQDRVPQEMPIANAAHTPTIAKTYKDHPSPHQESIPTTKVFSQPASFTNPNPNPLPITPTMFTAETESTTNIAIFIIFIKLVC